MRYSELKRGAISIAALSNVAISANSIPREELKN